MKIYAKGCVPNILVAGKVEEFRARLRTNQPANVVGSVAFVGSVGGQTFDLINARTIYLNGRVVDANELKNLAARGAFDYIVFVNDMNYVRHAQFLASKFVPGAQLLTIDYFVRNVGERFYTHHNDVILFRLLAQKQTRSLLDADAYFAEGQRYIKPFALNRLSIEGVRGERFFPIEDNFYDRIYDSPLDCRFRHYDAILLTAERDVDDLRAAIDSMREMTDEFIVFVRRNFDLNDKFFNAFVERKRSAAVNGNWITLRLKKSSELAIYVVTHKKHSIEPLPEGYLTIHAGRALGEDLGYLGDDTGENISELNPYLNELTALYWIWKNATQPFVGIAHYRRFFSTKGSNVFHAEDILSGTQARELLNRYDMLIGDEAFSINSQRNLMIVDAEYDQKLAANAVNLIKKMLERYQPTYADSFEQLMSNRGFFCCNMMITRKHVFDAYCQWLFSFILPSIEEFRAELEHVSTRQKRILGFVAERMFGVWLLKNNLRLRDFVIMVDQ